MALLCQLGLDQTDFEQEVSFDAFISAVEQTPISMMNSHWRPQYYQTFQSSINYDLIGRLETFEEDIATLGKMVSLDIGYYLRTWNVHQTDSKKKLDEFYNQDLKDRVYKIYQEDFEAFGYSK